MKGKILIILFIIVFSFFVSFSHAQVKDSDVVLSISPSVPYPNQNVTATISSHTLDLDRSNIYWTMDDQSGGGIGKKSFYFKMNDAGIPTTLTVSIDTIDGQNISNTTTINAAGVDLLWEAYDSYTPPFYRGKALVAKQGTFKVVAIPNLISKGNKVNPNNLSYTWKKDGDPQPDSSGWGKNYLIFQNSFLDRQNNVDIKVSDILGSTTASGKIILNTVAPKIIFYGIDDLLGTKWENSLTGLKVNTSGSKFIAEPYFFSPKDIKSSSLSYDWSINGNKIETPFPKNLLYIKPENGKTGSASIKVIINNVNTLFQNMEKQIKANLE